MASLSLLRLLLVLATIVALGHLPASSQEIDENNFTLYTRQQGLSGNLITGMMQDSTGFIWTSTTSGLNRFNGSSFVQFHSENDSLSLPSEYVKGLVQLNKRNIASFGDGLHIVDTYTGEVSNLFVPYFQKQYQYKFNWIMAVNSNARGDIFVLARSGFYHFNKAHQLIYRYDYYSKEQVPSTPFVFGRYLFMLDQNHLALVTQVGIYYYDAERKALKKMGPADCPLLARFLDYPEEDYQFFQPKPECLFVIKSNADSLYYIDLTAKKTFTTTLTFAARKEFDYRSKVTVISDTAFYITGKNSGFYKIIFTKQKAVQFYAKKYFSSYSCRDILKDRDGDLWIATNEGLLQEIKNKTLVRRIDLPEPLLSSYPNITIGEVVTTKDLIIAACSGGGGGLLVFDKKTLRFIKRIGFENCYRHPEELRAISALSEGLLLAGSNGPLFKVDVSKGTIGEVPMDQWDRAHSWIADILTDKKKDIWISSKDLYHYDKQANKAIMIPLAHDLLEKIEWTQLLEEDASGNIWLAGHGVLRYNNQLKKIDRFVDSFPFIKIPDRQVNSFIADDQNHLWININNNGLVCYDIANGSFHHFTRENGLPENNIASMILVKGKLWLATLSGISCLDIKTSSLSTFGREDGFPDQPLTKGSHFFYDSVSNKIYIGFTNSLLRFDPDIANQQLSSPRLFIESFATNRSEKFLPHEDDFTTSWRNNEIKITIGSINFFSSSSQRFAFRLADDANSNWQDLANRNAFNISNLTPGHHKVEVKLYSINNRWPSQVKKIDIVILPPFWERSWFYYLGAFFLAIALYFLIKSRINAIRKKEQEKTHIQKLKAEEYKVQFELEQISNYFSSSFAEKKNVDDVLWDVSKNLIGWLNYEDCMIYLWNEDQTKMIQKAWYGPKGDPASPHITPFDVLPGQGVVGHVMVTKEPLIIGDTRQDSRYRVDDAFRLSEVCVPIIHNDQLIGIIDSEHSQINHFNERDIKILTTIATLVSNKIKQIESEQSLLVKQKEIFSINQQLAEAQLQALQTQMNPHFLFNSLNGIKGMILDNEQQRASRYMTKFANLLRITLHQSREVFTTLCENIEQLENYLTMEKLRFDDSFTFRITADKHIDQEETLIPTMMIQPLAENAIWHGLMPKKGNKKLSIHFSMMDDMIYCTVEDNGIGLRNSERLKKLKRPLHESLGLTNLRNRIKILNEKYDTGCSLELFDLQDIHNERTGSCAVLSFKMIINHPTYESNLNR